MAWSFAALAAGAILGLAGWLPAKSLPWLRRLTSAGLVILLFTMGAQIGGSPDLMADMGTMGARAAILAFAAIMGSVLAVALVAALRWLPTPTPGSTRLSGSDPPGATSWALPALILGSVASGLLAGFAGVLPVVDRDSLAQVGQAALGLILLGIGVELGRDSAAWQALRLMGLRVLLIPAAIAAGSILGALVAGAIVGLPVNESTSIGAGFGWYSLSGLLLAQSYDLPTGALAFLTNVLRELMAVVTMPVLARWVTPAIAIAPGGATTMDTTLPVIARSMGPAAATIAFASGATLTALVPVLVPLLIQL